MDLSLGNHDIPTSKDVFRDLGREYRKNAASEVTVGNN